MSVADRGNFGINSNLFLALQVLSMSRLGGAGAVAPLIADVPSQVL